MITLRDYQQSILDQVMPLIHDYTNSGLNAVIQLETGAGKSPIFPEIIRQIDHNTIVIAHKNLLIEQLSATLSSYKINHHLITNSATKQRCQIEQRKKGVSVGGNCFLGSVQSIVSRHQRGKLDMDKSAHYKIFYDEGHHVTEDNIWGEIAKIFPNSQLFNFTATPCRTDGKPLGREYGGLFDVLIQAEQLKEDATSRLIARGYLSDYEYYAPPLLLPLDQLKLSPFTKDYNLKDIDQILGRENIAGHLYNEWRALNKAHSRELAGLPLPRTLMFAPSIANAEHVSDMFKQNGVSASYIASSLSMVEVNRRIDAFKNGDITYLCNVEMATEGFDLPDIECLQVARPTMSFRLYKQMTGRALRPSRGGGKKIIIDHVGNVIKHGKPDDHIEWSLSGTPKNKSERVIHCRHCYAVFNIFMKACPVCGTDNLLRDKNAEGDTLVKARYLDIQLVRLVRSKIKQQEMDEAKKKAQEIKAQEFKTVILNPIWHFSDTSLIERTCKKIAFYVIDNVKDIMPVEQVNTFTQGKQPPASFFSKHFTVNDLKKPNPNKCKRFVEEWLRSN